MQSGLDHNFSHRLGVAWQYINRRDVNNGIKHCQQLNAEFPGEGEGWFATSFLALQLKQVAQALILIDKALKLEPEQVRWQLHKAHCLLVSGDRQGAKDIVLPKVNEQFNDIEEHAEIALIFNNLSLFAQARQHYQLAIAGCQQTKRLATLYFNLASVQRYLGELVSAEQNLDRALAINPADCEAQLLRSGLKKQSAEHNHIQQLTRLSEREGLAPIPKAQAYYALAKEYEDLQQYASSFDALEKGANTRRANMRYDVRQDIATIEKITTVFNRSFFAQNAPGYDNNEAIFILGLPRTGSTLIERIISQHSQVTSAGELNNFAMQMMAQVKQRGKKPPASKLDLVAMTADIDFAALGKAYIDSTRPETGVSAHFIDKLPLNSLYVGLIHKALPKAKIIYVNRHPLATCFAIYKQIFTNGYPFSYDLKELAQYYIAHHKMMNHWQKMLPDALYTVNYEDVVDDITGQSQALMDYCQLAWQAHQIEFEKNEAASTTASATQVRQGIYTSSKDKWRHVAEQLAPIAQQLNEAGITWD